MEAKIIFYKCKDKLPTKIQSRSKLTFGEMFHCYGEMIDEIYICDYESKAKNENDWIQLGEECYTLIKDKCIANLELNERDCERINLKDFLEGIYKADYRFEHYKSEKVGKSISVKVPESFLDTFNEARAVAVAVHIARDICNEPANVIFPESYASYLMELFKGTKVEVKIIDGHGLKKEGFYAVEAVGRGSSYEPCVAVLTLKNNDNPPLALIGKGVTFDSGGVNVKMGTAIAEMKMDLGGAAAVTGAVKLLADMDTACHVIAILPLAVNVSGSCAYLPSECIRFRNGTTVEVGNTDAEGRLLLADAILYAQHIGINQIIDIATLTGNVGQALGLKIAAAYSNNMHILNKVYECGQKSGDYVWPMPLERDYKCYLRSQVADISNMSSTNFAGSITAALFIEHFVEEKTSWVHIDMANTSKTFPDSELGASGYGTKILYELVLEREGL